MALVELDGLDTTAFASPAYGQWHLDYPLLVPAQEAFAFRLGVGVRAVHLEFWLPLAAFVGSLVELLRPRVGRLLAWSLGAQIVWTPKVATETVSANVDMPLAIFSCSPRSPHVSGCRRNTAAHGLVPALRSCRSRDEVGGCDRGRDRLGVALRPCAAPLAPAGGAPRGRRRRGAGRIHTVAAVDDADDAPTGVRRRLHRRKHEGPRGERSRRQLAAAAELFDPEVWLAARPARRCAPTSNAVLGASARRCPLAVAASAALLIVVAHRDRARDPTSPFEWRSEYGLLFLPAVLRGVVFVLASRTDRPRRRRSWRCRWAGSSPRSSPSTCSRRTTSLGSSAPRRAVSCYRLGSSRQHSHRSSSSRAVEPGSRGGVP